jgi:hypothetical protein
MRRAPERPLAIEKNQLKHGTYNVPSKYYQLSKGILKSNNSYISTVNQKYVCSV